MRALFDRTTDDFEVWEEVTERCDGEVFAGVFAQYSIFGFEVGPDVIVELGRRGLRIGFDAYSNLS